MPKRLRLTLLAGSLAALAVAAAAGEPPRPKAVKGDWTLVFSDEFDGPGLDRDKWTTCYWWDKDGCTNLGNAELQWYMPENVSVANGYLMLTARPEKVTGFEGRPFSYTSGMVTTGRDYVELPRLPRAEFLYGHFEIRAKLPAGAGLWPALWLLPSTRESRPEIDIMEVLGDAPRQLHLHVHYDDKKGEIQRPGKTVETKNLARRFHVYGLTWSKDAIHWYLDGKKVWTFDDTDYISSEPMYLLMNLAVGGKWPGPPDERTKFPAEFIIDYVRVWTRSEK